MTFWVCIFALSVLIERLAAGLLPRLRRRRAQGQQQHAQPPVANLANPPTPAPPPAPAPALTRVDSGVGL
jgi:hypothetical protein